MSIMVGLEQGDQVSHLRAKGRGKRAGQLVKFRQISVNIRYLFATTRTV